MRLLTSLVPSSPNSGFPLLKTTSSFLPLCASYSPFSSSSSFFLSFFRQQKPSFSAVRLKVPSFVQMLKSFLFCRVPSVRAVPLRFMRGAILSGKASLQIPKRHVSFPHDSTAPFFGSLFPSLTKSLKFYQNCLMAFPVPKLFPFVSFFRRNRNSHPPKMNTQRGGQESPTLLGGSKNLEFSTQGSDPVPIFRK